MWGWRREAEDDPWMGRMMNDRACEKWHRWNYLCKHLKKKNVRIPNFGGCEIHVEEGNKRGCGCYG
jgi:hypothetical protein